MARRVDPRSWPFAVPARHPSQILFWGAVAVYAVNLGSLLLSEEGLPAWTLAVALALQLASAAWARVVNARARREVGPASS